MLLTRGTALFRQVLWLQKEKVLLPVGVESLVTIYIKLLVTQATSIQQYLFAQSSTLTYGIHCWRKEGEEAPYSQKSEASFWVPHLAWSGSAGL